MTKTPNGDCRLPCRLRYMQKALIILLAFIITALNAYADDCFSPPPSVQQGRGKFEDIVPRNLEEGEFQNLKQLFHGLEGDWKGSAEVLVCEGSENDIRKQIDNYAVTSELKMNTSGRFVIKSTLSSRKKRNKHHVDLHLYLSKEKLSSEANAAVADIELILVSNDELVYVKKARSRSGGGAALIRETITAIKKSGESSFIFEQLVYLQGMLKSISTWHLEKK